MEVIVWSKNNCPHCEQAKTLLKQKGVNFIEHKIGHGWTREDLLAAVPTARTVPQIFWNGVCIGGLEELKKRIG